MYHVSKIKLNIFFPIQHVYDCDGDTNVEHGKKNGLSLLQNSPQVQRTCQHIIVNTRYEVAFL